MIKTVPSFSFEVGDTLANYFIKDTAAKDTANIDVHGNQFGLLAASKCFKMSGMTCTTCHNTHLNQRGMEEMFSQKCMSCHNEQHNNFCKLASQIGTTITKIVSIAICRYNHPKRSFSLSKALQNQPLLLCVRITSGYIQKKQKNTLYF